MPVETTNLREGTESQAVTDVNKKPDASSAEQGAQKQEKTETLETVIQDVLKSHSSGEKADAASGVRKSNETEGEEEEKSEGEQEGSQTQEQKVGQEVEGEKKDGEEEEELKEGEAVPYERFQEVVAKKNEFETKLKELEPGLNYVAEITSHLQKHDITEKQFGYWMDVAALVNTDPTKALETLKPILERLQGFTGDKLPADLQTMVDNNEISLDVAKRLAKAENQQKFGQQRQEKTAQQIQAERHQAYVGELTETMNKWLDGKRASDPDFSPKKSPEDPDGKFEFFLHKMETEAKTSVVNNKAELSKLAEKVYTSLNASFSRFTPKRTVTKSVNSKTTSNDSKSPENLNDVISATAAKHGINFSPNRK